MAGYFSFLFFFLARIDAEFSCGHSEIGFGFSRVPKKFVCPNYRFLDFARKSPISVEHPETNAKFSFFYKIYSKNSKKCLVDNRPSYPKIAQYFIRYDHLVVKLTTKGRQNFRKNVLMDMASDFGSEDCGFESHRGQVFAFESTRRYVKIIKTF